MFFVGVGANVPNVILIYHRMEVVAATALQVYLAALR
jgi:hypothetical protein